MVWCVSEGERGADEPSGMLVGRHAGLPWSGGISRAVQIRCKDWDGGGLSRFCKDVSGSGFRHISGTTPSTVPNWTAGCVALVFGP